VNIPGFNSENFIILDDRIIIYYPANTKRNYLFFSMYDTLIGNTFIKRWLRDLRLEDIYDWRKKHPKGRIPKGIEALRKHLMDHCPEIFYI
jgi:hypothetical protein